MLDNREISILTWLAVLAVFCASKPEIRKAGAGVVRAALAPKLLIPIVMIAAYVGAGVAVLHHFEIWGLSNLKATVLWFFTAGLAMVGEVAESQQEDRYFLRAVLDGFKISVVLEFVVNFYPLPLIGELVLVPFTAFLACMLVIAESKEEFKPVRTLLNGLLSIFGLGLLAYAGYRIYADAPAFLAPATFAEFLLPILLTIVCLPCLWLLATYVSYENLFVRLQFFISDASLRSFVKAQLLLRLHLNYPAVNRWSKLFIPECPSTREAVLESIVRARLGASTRAG